MKKFNMPLIFIVLLLLNLNLFGQIDPQPINADSTMTDSLNVDSLNIIALAEYSQKIARIEQQRLADFILKEPKPFVLQTSLEDFYVAYQINAYTHEASKQASIYSSLHQNIQDVCNENGVEILSPHYRAARDGNMITIPANYLPEDYQMPGFKINIDKNDDK